MSAPVVVRPAAATTRLFARGAPGQKYVQSNRPPSKPRDGTQQRLPKSGGSQRFKSPQKLDAQGKPLPFWKKSNEPKKPYIHVHRYGVPPSSRGPVPERGIHLNPQIQTWKPWSSERLQTLLNPEHALFRGSLPMMSSNLNVLSKEWGRLRDVECLANPEYLKKANGVMSPLERARHVLARNSTFKRKQALTCVHKVEELIGSTMTSATPKPAA